MTALTVRAVAVARAALLEAGRPDLAADIHPYGAGWPAHRHAANHSHPDRPVLLKAFLLGHEAAGHHVSTTRDQYLLWSFSS